MMRNNDFVVFILTHGRADRVITYNALRKSGYTGRIVLVIDNEDTQAREYISVFQDFLCLGNNGFVQKIRKFSGVIIYKLNK